MGRIRGKNNIFFLFRIFNFLGFFSLFSITLVFFYHVLWSPCWIAKKKLTCFLFFEIPRSFFLLLSLSDLKKNSKPVSVKFQERDDISTPPPLYYQCTFDGKRDNKTNFICSKCEIPLHVLSCFQASIFCSIEILSSNFLLGQGIIITSFYRLPILDEIFFTISIFFFIFIEQKRRKIIWHEYR